ncbi:hypothetical protein [Mycoplasma sp. 3686d]|uniref:hypothetical protein n=1 Tax=Mycoplasma sp. 3686d TaxID=2967300 RepID=UPI00211C77FF|nr:hypothetical protein [Mycoplasma sp. 3686d]UUM24645.1 hypothetical protein NPA12_03035 [Mycoplasma sp. 3686d]
MGNLFKDIETEYMKAKREIEKIERRKEKLEQDLEKARHEYVEWTKITKKIEKFIDQFETKEIAQTKKQTQENGV